MAVDIEKMSGSLTRVRKREAIEFKLLFAAAYLVFLAAAIVSRLLPRSLSPWGASVSPKSVFAEAKAAANTCLPFAFMR